ncbi:Ti-type conjugative transfer relaxase TraA [Candidatus Finniella inopinata]|nr:Ti-type conjugative transfer relaxase TraA [Candidatus Finniella inopinata]
MAQYHLTIKNISRADGRNAVKSAAYRHGKNFTCESVGETFYYGKKKDVEHCEVSVPENAPEWAKCLTKMDAHEASQKLWNAVEVIEKRKDARLSKEVEFSLPHEMNKEKRLDLARSFIQETFTSKGMIADWCVHNHFDEKDGIEKPHVHVMLTTRVLKEDPTVSMGVEGREGQNDFLIYKGICFGEKDRSWNDKKLVQEIRQSWELFANKHLEKAGLDIRIDHRSYEAQGIEFDPQPKLGKGPEEMHSRGISVSRLEDLERVKQANKKLIIKDPGLVLDYITRQKSVFTRQDIARVLNRYVDDVEEFQILLGRVEASSQLVKVYDRVGVASVDPQKLTTKGMIALERSLMKQSHMLKEKESSGVASVTQSSVIQGMNEQMGRCLSSDQVRAIYHMTDAGQLKVVVGYAGAGKSTCLKVAKQIWENEGYRVLGAAPTGKAADNLEGIGIASKTLHKWQYEWSMVRETIGEGDILVVDEAGMVDSRRLQALLRQSLQHGFKVVLIGDPEQLSPIEAGCGLRTLMDKAGFVEINTIQRQGTAWQREATAQLATKQTGLALKAYAEKGCVHLVADAKEQLITAYAAQMATKLREEALDCVILAHTNRDVKDLNERARQVARESSRLLGEDHLLTVSRYNTDDHLVPPSDPLPPKITWQTKSFARGDQIVFLRNDYGIGVKNGQFGVIQKIDEGMLQVELQDRRVLRFDLSLYSSFDHGYATTLHKSQGDTVERTFLYASGGMDRHLTYVGLSRHSQEVHIYADKTDFKHEEHLFRALSRDNPKENVFDYRLEPVGLQPEISVEQSYSPVETVEVMSPLFPEPEQSLEPFEPLRTTPYQFHQWHREATSHLQAKNTRDALEIYDEKGCLHWVEKSQDKLVEDYVTRMGTRLREEALDGVILTQTTQGARLMNDSVRIAARKSERLYGTDHLLKVVGFIGREEKAFAVGEQIVFLKDDETIGVKAGQFGVIQKIDTENLKVELQNLQDVVVPLSSYRAFDYGYAITVEHAADSKIARTFLYVDRRMHPHALYAGLSRHTNEAHIYANTASFKSKSHLFEHVSSYKPYTELDLGIPTPQDWVPSAAQPSRHRHESILQKVSEKMAIHSEHDLVAVFMQLDEKIDSFPYPLKITPAESKQEESLMKLSREVSFHISKDPDLMKKVNNLGLGSRIERQASDYSISQSPEKVRERSLGFGKGRGMGRGMGMWPR